MSLAKASLPQVVVAAAAVGDIVMLVLWYRLFWLSASITSPGPVHGVIKGMLMCAFGVGDLRAASQRGAEPTPSLLGAKNKQAL